MKPSSKNSGEHYELGGGEGGLKRFGAEHAKAKSKMIYCGF